MMKALCGLLCLLVAIVVCASQTNVCVPSFDDDNGEFKHGSSGTRPIPGYPGREIGAALKKSTTISRKLAQRKIEAKTSRPVRSLPDLFINDDLDSSELSLVREKRQPGGRIRAAHNGCRGVSVYLWWVRGCWIVWPRIRTVICQKTFCSGWCKPVNYVTYRWVLVACWRKDCNQWVFRWLRYGLSVPRSCMCRPC